jgi:two-component system response regulator AtoC
VDDARALVIAADEAVRRRLVAVLHAHGYESVTACSIDDALEPVAHSDFRFTIIDLNVNGHGGLGMIPRLKLQGGDPGPIIGLASRTDGAGANGELNVPGVDHVISDPVLWDELEGALRQDRWRPRSAAKSALDDAAAVRVSQEMGLWRSPRMVDVKRIVEEAASADVTVLVTGETGTGKDVAARGIHYLSPRRNGPFVKVNCAAVPRELLESELFGHERGAFTGAHKLKIGKFEAAHRGTIFLDEIGDLHPALQAKLLHVLQDGDFSRVGGKSSVKVDVRIVAATNQELGRAVAEGRFREDLYYRLNVIQIVMPPLRQRLDEIPVLVEYFVKMYAKLFRRQGFAIPPEVMERLVRYGFPGNVRELENLVKRMIVLDDPFLERTPLLTRDGGPASVVSPAPRVSEMSLRDICRRASLTAERETLAKVLDEHGWNRVRTAKFLKISYRALLYKIKRSGLQGERLGGPPAGWRSPERPGGWEQ